ncbi:MAG: hypothetical protein WA210_19885 [Burkholderiaceae bacterium]
MQSSLESGSALLNAALTLRELNRGRRARLVTVHRGADGRLLALIDAAAGRIYSTRPLEQIVDALASGAGALREIDPAQERSPRPNVRLADESFERLCWLIGLRLGRDAGLAPWINAQLTYRLLNWPDFGEIGSDPQGVQLCKVIAQRDLGIAAMADMAQLAQRTVHALLNSLSLCGVLAIGPAQRAGAGETPPRRSPGVRRKRGLLERLWRRLRGHFKAAQS